MNIPLEAWSAKGLSALASRIGTPLIMDAMTTRICTQRMDILEYARVLVEINAQKGLEDYIDVLYKCKERWEISYFEKQKDNEGFINVKNRKTYENGGNRNVQLNKKGKPVVKKDDITPPF
ncbi:hypothetical protein Tco_1265523 [Tanacetum coccineum]